MPYANNEGLIWTLCSLTYTTISHRLNRACVFRKSQKGLFPVSVMYFIVLHH